MTHSSMPGSSENVLDSARNTPLSNSLDLGPQQHLSNRIAKAAMSERLADRDGAPTTGLLRVYDRWARGGAGLLISGHVMIDRRAMSEHGNVAIEDERHMDALRAWAQTVKVAGAASGNPHGTRMWLQINHPGRQVPRFLSKEPVAPSPVPVRMNGLFARPRALSDSEIKDLIARFARTAAIVEAAGFDGVEIHGAHGYLINQFLSPLTNLRDDDWGGSAERRRRFLLEVVGAVKAAVSDDFTVAVKLNSADFQRGGFDEEESMAVISALDEVGIDVLEISGGTYESAVMFEETVPKHESSRRREAFFVDYAEKVRTKTRLPLMVTGGFRTREGMEDALRSKAADIVGLARPLVVEPDLPSRILSGTAESAKPIRLATGIKSLDAMIQGAWYQAQIDRMASGHLPKARLSRLISVVRYFLPSHRYPKATAVHEDDVKTVPAAA